MHEVELLGVIGLLTSSEVHYYAGDIRFAPMSRDLIYHQSASRAVVVAWTTQYHTRRRDLHPSPYRHHMNTSLALASDHS